MAVYGKYLLENLTTGMYQDSKVIYREYIQNACDQIDKAIQLGIVKRDEAEIAVTIDDKNRYICIEDNATGASAETFISDLGDIANSKKELGEDKGFRGIGRLCGLAYCKTLKFTASSCGEEVASIMVCNAKKMREMLMDSVKYTHDEIWDEIVSYDTKNEEIDAHYFRVELFDINRENTDLLDSKGIRDYLSFVAPVPYKATFLMRKQIYDYVAKKKLKLDEYDIRVNGAPIYKEYTTAIKEPGANNSLKQCDDIFDIEFHDFYNERKQLIAWMWFGISRFEKQIKSVNAMRGIRLRSANIQIGESDQLRPLFKDGRGIFYFVGEVHAVDKGLIPNSQRSYFNENESRVVFEEQLRKYFSEELQKIYNKANDVKNAHKKVTTYIEKSKNFEDKKKNGGFINEEDKIKLQLEVEEAKKKADSAQKEIAKYKQIDKGSAISKVVKSIEKEYKTSNIENTQVNQVTTTQRTDYVTSSLSKLSRSERKLVSKIMSIITDNAEREVAEKIIEKIKEELR